MRPSYWIHQCSLIWDRFLRTLYGDQGLLVRKRVAARLLIVLVILTFAFIWSRESSPSHLQRVLDSGTLRVATRLGPLIYYQRDEQAGGLDYYILQAFADSLGLNLEITVIDDLQALLEAVESGQFDIAAANLTITAERAKRVRFSDPYLEVTSVLIQHSSQSVPRNIESLGNEEIVVIANSSHAEILRRLSEQHPELNWSEEPNTIMFELMERIQNEEIALAVVDSSVFDLERPFFPRVEIAMTLDEPSPMAFALANDGEQSLEKALNQFLSEYRASGELEYLVDNVFSHNEIFNVAGSLVLRERMDDRLPELEPLFRKVAAEVSMDWLLLAAAAYQESHWEADARSYTGVRGLMMLTLPTAQQFGVDDRLDPVQSLNGGARYLLSLRDRLPDRIAEPDRTKMALAAYNIGMGHLEDARVLTDRAGRNPDSWDDVREHLPLLQQGQYYRTVNHGYARGTEAATYVENIYHFYNILESWAWQRELEAQNLRMEFEEDLPAPEPRPYPSILDHAIAPL